jgi:poly(hydroxyalkanoate) depolymerase family esterase
MNNLLSARMLEATRLTREGRLAEASAVLQGAAPGGAASVAGAPTGSASRVFDVDPDTGEAAPRARPAPAMPEALRGLMDRFAGHAAAGDAAPRGGPAGAMPELPEALRGMMDRFARAGTAPAAEPLPPGARFLSGSFASEAGSRGYRLYVPAARRAEPMPLVVMLHGCTQSPEDFAAGTRMNALAEEHGCLVAYPGQTQAANAQKCWNWFSPDDQERDRGEPAIIAGIARQVLREHGGDGRRVYAAGLSAGGAAAAIMGAAYPELFAAIGVHSGLACGAARDMPSAFAAMRQGGSQGGSGSRRAGGGVPTIVFHADKDATVHPRNGEQVIAQAGGHAGGAGLRVEVERGQVPGGHAFTRSLHRDAQRRVMLEHWLIHGGGHAWSGGSPAGTYTDPRGPDASREMLRFFLEHRSQG